MRRRPVQSTVVRSVGHDSATNVLEVEWVDGSVYRYFAVPATVYADLINASSIGAFINSRIKPKYRDQYVG